METTKSQFRDEDVVALERGLDAEIKKNRILQADLIVTSGGRALPGLEVEIEQTSHKLLFGTNWSALPIGFFDDKLSGEERERADSRARLFLDVFNQATLPFYWERFEPERGRPITEMIRKAALWYKERGIVLKGHTLCWHTLAPSWLLEMTEDEILDGQRSRIRREVSDFAGLVDMWDVVNEAVIMPVYDRYDNGLTRLCKKMGREKLVKTMFDEAREANPGATLLLNDFNTSQAYADLIGNCLESGSCIDVIGIQSHMHQGWWGIEKTQTVLKRFETFGLPIHFTETTIVSGELMPPEIEDLNDYRPPVWPSTPEGEERQAREAVLHYKTLVAHPSVEAVVWWDLVDGAWLGAPCGLLRKDGSSKPAFEALKSLIKDEWWLGSTKLRTDENGRITVRGFAGDYRLSVRGARVSFSLERGGDGIPITLV
jgi:GH35 family endo-1,4-beta-xylanase